MRAEAYPSVAMVSGVRLIPGFQAGCDNPACGDDRVYLAETPMARVSAFRDLWVHARLDAIEHNLEHHPMPRQLWPL